MRVEPGDDGAVAIFFAHIGSQRDRGNMLRQVGAAGAHRANEIVAIASRHRDVADQYVELPLCQALFGGVHRAGRMHLRARVHQELHHRLA